MCTVWPSHSKWLRVEQRICIKFCAMLEHSSAETILMIRRPQLWATGDWQFHHTSHLTQSFLAKYQITLVTQPLQQPRFGILRLLAFPNTKITFEREEISDCWWNSGKYDGAADGNWENCVRSPGAYFEGDWGVIVLCAMFLVSSLINVFFTVHGWILSGHTSYTSIPFLIIKIYTLKNIENNSVNF